MGAIDRKEARSLVDRLGPSLGYDNTYDPSFPETRKDVCAIIRMAENGTSYGFDTLYLLWKPKNELCHMRIDDTSRTKEYLSFGKIFEDGRDIVVQYSASGNKEFRVSKKELGLQ